MEGEGFEPPNPKERIYSPPRLASSLPFQNHINKMARDGIEPPTHGASIHCSTNWATEPYCGSRIWTYDLRVMSPTSYLAAPSRDTIIQLKGGCGIRTHARFYTPDGFQDRSLQPDLGNPPLFTMDLVGLEPTTTRLWAESSNQLS